MWPWVTTCCGIVTLCVLATQHLFWCCALMQTLYCASPFSISFFLSFGHKFYNKITQMLVKMNPNKVIPQCDWAHSWQCKRLWVNPLILYGESSQFRWFRLLVRLHTGLFSLETHQVADWHVQHWTHWRDFSDGIKSILDDSTHSADVL